MLEVHPLTPERWGDLERLFGPSGGYSNCWCSFQRVTGREYAAGCENRGAGNRALLRRLTDEGHRPGLIAYRGAEPVGWVSVGPRPEFGRMLRSPVLGLSAEEKADPSVWSIVCFFLPRANRGQGIGPALLAAAVEHARASGARAVEAYPVDTRGRRVDSNGIFTGTLDMFEREGFATVHERVPGRPMVRREV